jgi:hypothetical protein
MWDTLGLFACSESWSYEWWEDLKRWTLSRKVSFRTWTEIRRREKETWGK